MTLLVLFIIFFVTDITTNILDGVPAGHIWHEVLLCLLAIGSLIWQLVTISRKDRQIQGISHELAEGRKNYQKRSHDQATQLRTLIDQQFAEWQLSHSEMDVALLLIKGLSMKEIAEIRSTQEKTVRQQAAMIYKKSKLSGRQELAAFFLEDILDIRATV